MKLPAVVKENLNSDPASEKKHVELAKKFHILFLQTPVCLNLKPLGESDYGDQ